MPRLQLAQIAASYTTLGRNYQYPRQEEHPTRWGSRHLHEIGGHLHTLPAGHSPRLRNARAVLENHRGLRLPFKSKISILLRAWDEVKRSSCWWGLASSPGILPFQPHFQEQDRSWLQIRTCLLSDQRARCWSRQDPMQSHRHSWAGSRIQASEESKSTIYQFSHQCIN